MSDVIRIAVVTNKSFTVWFEQISNGYFEIQTELQHCRALGV